MRVLKTSNHLSKREGKVIEYTRTQTYKVVADCLGDRELATLLSAAPDLLEALEGMVRLCRTVAEGRPELEAARKAVQKAKGLA